jgi:UDP-3-O-[3-hydroxymyristoyl] glucosamine N-acyltransferase
VTLDELARRLGCRLEGDGAIDVSRVAAIDEAGPGDLTFLTNPKYASSLASTRASPSSRTTA